MIKFQVNLDQAQYRRVRNELMQRFPDLAKLAQERRLQTTNHWGAFSLAAVRGAQLPEEVNSDAVREVIQRIIDEQPFHMALWAEQQTIKYARRMR